MQIPEPPKPPPSRGPQALDGEVFSGNRSWFWPLNLGWVPCEKGGGMKSIRVVALDVVSEALAVVPMGELENSSAFLG